MSQDSEFDRLLDASFDRLKRSFKPGEKVTGTIVSLGAKTVLVDIQAKSEGILDRSELEEDGEESTLAVGDTVEAYYMGQERGEIILAARLKTTNAGDEDVQRAYEAGIPVQGKVTGANSGGLEVEVGGMRGFCPVSQIDQRHVEEPASFVGTVLTFRIMEYDGDNLVLSRRQHLEQEQAGDKERLREGLAEGDLIPGTVANIRDFGVFVNLGGVDGLIPMSELAWDHTADATEVVSPGDTVTVKVIGIDWGRDRITLSLKQAGPDPWDDIADRFLPGMPCPGKITKLMDFGAFVRIAPGVEGLLHISKLGDGKRLSHPSDVVHEGQELDVYVDEIDRDRHRISLSLENAQIGRSLESGDASVTVGATIDGTVEDTKPYGVFVKLNARQSGLLHISEIEAVDERANGQNLHRSYPRGAAIQVVVKGIHGGKISLGLPGGEDRQDVRSMIDEERKKSSGFGSLGDAFGNLNL